MAKQSAPDRPASDPAEQAMATLLRAERQAREAIERTRIEADQMVEAAHSRMGWWTLVFIAILLGGAWGMARLEQRFSGLRPQT